jgi:hypothetical protein
LLGLLGLLALMVRLLTVLPDAGQCIPK